MEVRFSLPALLDEPERAQCDPDRARRTPAAGKREFLGGQLAAFVVAAEGVEGERRV